MLVLVLVSLSRMALAASVLVIWLSQLAPGSARARWKFTIVGTLLIGVCLVGITRYEPLRDRFFEGDVSLKLGAVTINGMGRVAMWRATLESAATSPIVGHGAGSAAEIINSRFNLGHPHNDYLRVLHDYGLVGLVLWIFALAHLGWGARKGWIVRHRSKDYTSSAIHRAAYLGIVGTAVTMITDNSMAYYMIMIPLAALVGASIGLHRRDAGNVLDVSRIGETNADPAGS
jgi:O-antigen ligase